MRQFAAMINYSLLKIKTSIISLLFQFHNGAIGVYLFVVVLQSALGFQFHNGAIGVTYRLQKAYRLFKFQFHNGAIGVK